MEKDCITAFEGLRKRTKTDEDEDVEQMIKRFYSKGPECQSSWGLKSKKLKVEKKTVTMSDLLDEKGTRHTEVRSS